MRDYIATIWLQVEVRVDIQAKNDEEADTKVATLLEEKDNFDRLEWARAAIENGSSVHAEVDELECVGGGEETV